jgi:arylsulfatase A-like enzyme
VAGLDDSMGAIIAALRENKLLDETFIFFASDNGAPAVSRRGEGGGSNAPYREHKRSLYDGGMHSPGIISWPGRIPAGQTRDQLVCALDVLPTVAEIIGASLPEKVVLDGQSWTPLFARVDAPGHERLFFEWAGQHAVRQGNWKLVENGLMNLSPENRNNRAQGSDTNFLSEVKSDPGEKHNQQSQHPEIARELSAAHRAWLEQFPRKDE